MQRDFAKVLIKTVGLVIFVLGLVALLQSLLTLPFVDASNRISTTFVILSADGLYLLAGIGLYYGAGYIADRASSAEQRPAENVSRIDYRGVEEIALSVLGVFILTGGLANAASEWTQYELYYSRSSVVTQPELAAWASTATRIAVGLLLFLCSRGVATLRRRILDLRPLARPDH